MCYSALCLRVLAMFASRLALRFLSFSLCCISLASFQARIALIKNRGDSTSSTQYMNCQGFVAANFRVSFRTSFRSQPNMTTIFTAGQSSQTRYSPSLSSLFPLYYSLKECRNHAISYLKTDSDCELIQQTLLFFFKKKSKN